MCSERVEFVVVELDTPRSWVVVRGVTDGPGIDVEGRQAGNRLEVEEDFGMVVCDAWV